MNSKLHTLAPLVLLRVRVILFDLWKTLARATYPEPVDKLRDEILSLRGLAILWTTFFRTKPAEAITRLNEILGRPDTDASKDELGWICERTAAHSLDDYLYAVGEACNVEIPLGRLQNFHALANEYFLRVCLTTPHKDRQLYVETVCAHFGIDVPEDAHRKFADLVRWEKQGLAWFNDVARELVSLRRQGYQIGLITNSWPFPLDELLEILQEYALPYNEPLFDHVISSHEVGMAKQDGPGIYQLAARAFGVDPAECMMVGDNPDLDVIPARAAGMQTVLINRYPDEARFAPGVPSIGKLLELHTDDSDGDFR